MLNILVTGVGGGVGQGIIKSLKMITDLDIRIVSADMSELAAGLYAADVAYLVDRCDSPAYLDSLKIIFERESVDYYFPGTDVELMFCAKHKDLIYNDFSVRTVISSIETIEIADDKFKTFTFLKKRGFSYPETTWLKDFSGFSGINFPLIVKPAVGCRSIGVYKVFDEAGLLDHLKNPADIIVQELVGDEGEEYTCTVVKANGALSLVLPLKRDLRSGDTFRATPEKSQIIEDYVSDVALALEIEGACNFQLRLDANGVPKIFEINSRYSGTTPFCAQIGFNPVEYYLKHDLGLKYSPNIDWDSMLLRYWSEVVVKKQAMEQLSTNRSLSPLTQDQFNLFPNKI